LGLPGSFLRLPVGFLIYDITGSPQEAAKKFRAEIQEIISFLFWMKLLFHKDITDL
jgi:hypothetical protein